MTDSIGRRAVGERRARIALLDEQQEQLDSMTAWFREHAPDLDVALTATTWPGLVHSPAFPTDLVVIDVQLQEPVSLEARVRTCRAAGVKVIVRTAVADDEVRDRALRAGAAAFLPTTVPLEEVLVEVLRQVGTGSVWRPLPPDAVTRPRLSLGEEQALRLYVGGRSTNEVAIAMHVQFETAKTYLRRVREKYARAGRPAGRRLELMQRAAEDGMLD